MDKIKIDQLAAAALFDKEGFEQRAILLEFVNTYPILADVAPPATDDPVLRAISASLLELLARLRDQVPPAWTASVPELPQPVYVGMADVLDRPRMLALAQETAPPELRRRNLFAMGDYLTVA